MIVPLTRSSTAVQIRKCIIPKCSIALACTQMKEYFIDAIDELFNHPMIVDIRNQTKMHETAQAVYLSR